MPYNFNFQAPSRPLVNAPTGAFANLTGTLDRKYNEGELITEQAKDLFGTMDVATGDQVLRNQLSDEVATGLNQLVEDYKGAYESKQFQRDAKAYIRKMAADERIKVMRDTAEEEKFQKDLMRKSRMDKNMNLIQLGRDDVPASRYNPETGQWTAYVSPYEAGMDWLGDAKAHMDKFFAEEGSTPVDLEILKTKFGDFPLLKQGRYSQVTRDQVEARANELVDNFVMSNEGGEQMARKIAYDLSDGETTDIYDENGQIKEDIRANVARYLFDAASNQIRKSTQYSRSFLPASYMKQGSEEFNPYGTSTRVNLFNNTATNNAQELPQVGQDGELALTPKQAQEYKDLRSAKMAWQISGGAGEGTAGESGKYSFGEEEKKKLEKYEAIVDRGIQGYNEIILSYRKEDGSYDEDLEKHYPGLKDIYSDLIREYDPYGNYIKLDNVHSTLPEVAKLELDNRVNKRYTSRLNSLKVLADWGEPVTEDQKKAFDIQFLDSKSETGFGRIQTVGFEDREGNQLTFEQVANQEGYDLTDNDDRKDFKKSIALVENLIPLHDNGVAAVNLGGNIYKLKSDEVAKNYNAQVLSTASPVLKGEKRETDIITLSPLLVGKWVADETYSQDDTYQGNGAIFIYNDKKTGEPKYMTLSQAVEVYKKARR